MKKRDVDMDILRFVALLGVILVHASGDANYNVGTWEWNFYTWLSSAVTWQVPIYVMISGRYFLDENKTVTMATIWKKSVPRMVIAFAVWDVVYQIFYICTGCYGGLNIKGIIAQTLVGPYHFWFIYMIICLYAVTPFLRLFAAEKKLMEYFICLSLVFQFISSYGVLLPGIGSILSEIVDCTKFHFVLGFTGYFVLGYYLYRYPVKGILEKILYAAGCISLIGTATIATITQNSVFTQYLKTNVVIEAAALYVLFVNHISRIKFSETVSKALAQIAECSFGIYLVHALVLDAFVYMGVYSTRIHVGIMFPIMIILGFLGSMIVVLLIRKIPVIGKKIT